MKCSSRIGPKINSDYPADLQKSMLLIDSLTRDLKHSDDNVKNPLLNHVLTHQGMNAMKEVLNLKLTKLSCDSGHMTY